LLLVAAGTAVYHRTEILRRAKYSWAWHRLANHQWPDGEVVFSSVPEDVARLKDDRRYACVGQGRSQYVVRRCPTEYNAVFRSGIPLDVMPFVGRRSNGSGKGVLVGVLISPDSHFPFDSHVTGGPWDVDAVPVMGAPGHSTLILELVLGGLRIFGGTPNPEDETRFSFDFESHGRRGRVHGQVRGDQIRFDTAYLTTQAINP
jgi:hypothetical protein